MKIICFTDTHYGFTWETDKIHHKFLKKASEEVFDVLIHCGDIASCRQLEFEKSLKMFRDYFSNKPILIVRGNHDYWTGEPDVEDYNIHLEDKKTQRKKFQNFNLKKKNKWFDKKEWTVDEVEEFHNYVFKKYNIIHLNPTIPFTIKEVDIYGFDGWYNNSNPLTNDLYWMPKDWNGLPIHNALMIKSQKEMNELLYHLENEERKNKRVVVTHFDCFSDRGYESLGGDKNFPTALSSYVDLFLMGHSHQYKNINHMGMICRNVGSDYNRPKYEIIEI